MKVAQIFNNKAHWIFETEETIEQLKERFAPDIVFEDITGMDVQEGWGYDGEKFTDPNYISPDEKKKPALESLDAEYEIQFTELSKALALAALDDNSILVSEIKTEYAELKGEYKTKREAIESGS